MTTVAQTQAERDLAAYRAGQISLEELAARWAKRRMGEVTHQPLTAAEVYADADNRDYFEPGTWGEIRLMQIQGRLTPTEYRTVSRAADPPKPDSKTVKLFSTPTPPAVPVAGATAKPTVEPGSVTAAFNPDQPRDSDGKFAPGEGGDKITVPAESSGLSYQPFTDTEPKNGYMVALTGATTKVEVGQSPEATAKAITDYLDKHQAMFTKDPNLYLGGWVSGGVLWVEPSRNIADRADAVQQGQDTDQISVWDVKNGIEIPTGGTGGTGTTASILPAARGLGDDDFRPEAGLEPGAGAGDPPPGRSGVGDRITAGGDFDEDQHPRDEHGKFESTGGSGEESKVAGDTKYPNSHGHEVSADQVRMVYPAYHDMPSGEDAQRDQVAKTLGISRAQVDEAMRGVGNETGTKAAESPEYQYALNEWIGGTQYADDVANGDTPVYDPSALLENVDERVSSASLQTLTDAVQRDGTESNVPLYRGVSLSDQALAGMTVGSSVDLPVSSFTPHADIADGYGATAAALEGNQVRLEAPAGTRSIDISDSVFKVVGDDARYESKDLAEHLVAGRFTVAEIQPPTGNGPTVIKLSVSGGHITASFNPGQPRESDGKFASEGESGSSEQPKTVGSPEYRYAVNEWLGGTAFADYVQRTGTDHGGAPAGGPVADKVSDASRNLIQQAIENEGTKIDAPLFRGVGLSNAQVRAIEPGDTIMLPPSSFSPEADHAQAYAETSAIALEDMGLNSEEVMFETKGAQAIDISKQSEQVWQEPEYITAGKFTVLSVQPPDDSDTGTWYVRIRPGGK